MCHPIEKHPVVLGNLVPSTGEGLLDLVHPTSHFSRWASDTINRVREDQGFPADRRLHFTTQPATTSPGMDCTKKLPRGRPWVVAHRKAPPATFYRET